MDDREFDAYSEIVGILESEPMPTPTVAESAALSMALANAHQCRSMELNAPPRAVHELVGLGIASVVAFVIVATVLAMQVFGRINLASLPTIVGPTRLAAIVVAIITVTSFVPIAVTARRRPLNGMTFRR